MPKFVTIGYGDREGYEHTPVALRDAAHEHDAQLQKHGVLMAIAGAPVQVRNHIAAHVEIANGQFMTSALPLAGFAIVEAASWRRPSIRYLEALAPLRRVSWKSVATKPSIGGGQQRCSTYVR